MEAKRSRKRNVGAAGMAKKRRESKRKKDNDEATSDAGETTGATNTVSKLHSAKRNTLELQDLPEELLLQILSHLPLSDVAKRVGLVNHKFRQLCLDPSLWIQLRLPSERDHLEYRDLWSSDVDMNDAIRHPLRSLAMSKERAAQVVSRCTQLQHLYTERRADSNRLIITALKKPSKKRQNSKLKVVEIIQGTCISDSLLKAIERNGVALKELRLVDTGVGPRLDPMVVANCLKHLTSITLEMTFGYYRRGWTEEHFVALAGCCTNLRQLKLPRIESEEKFSVILERIRSTIERLSFQHWVTSAARYESLAKCQLLEELDLSSQGIHDGQDGFPIKINSLGSLATLPVLKSLKLRNVADFHTADLVMAFKKGSFPNLTSLEMKYKNRDSLNDAGLKSITDCCPSLTCLKMKGYRFFGQNRAALTAAGIRDLLSQCPQLWEVRLGNLRIATSDFEELRPLRWDLDLHMFSRGVDCIFKMGLLQCSICLQIRQDTLCPNSHKICSTCKANKAILNCPTCKADLDNVKCKNVGCDFHGRMNALLEHKTSCQFRKVPCYSSNCSVLPAKDMLDHLKKDHMLNIREDLVCTFNLMADVSNMDYKRNLSLMEYDGETFMIWSFVVSVFYFGVTLITGGLKMAQNYHAVITAEGNGNVHKSICQVYEGDRRWQEIIKEFSCFHLTQEQVKLCHVNCQHCINSKFPYQIQVTFDIRRN